MELSKLFNLSGRLSVISATPFSTEKPKLSNVMRKIFMIAKVNEARESSLSKRKLPEAAIQIAQIHLK
jgi:hypothetical protein